MNENDRNLNWDGCHNIRDLGGLATNDGGRTRWGSIIRADLLGRLTLRGKQELLDYGVRAIVDLRAAHEIEEYPPAVFTNKKNAPLYINPQLNNAPPAARARMKQARTRAELFILLLDHMQANQAMILRAIANAPRGGLVVHCHSGKDRTGITAGLLLSLAGVQEEAIAADYAASQERLWPLYQKWVDENGGVDEDDPWLIPITEPQTMREMLAHLAEKYGGTEAYLLQAGQTPEEIARLKSRLINP